MKLSTEEMLCYDMKTQGSSTHQ